MYSTRLDAIIKEQAKKEAEKFTKKELDQALENLLNYIQVSLKTATNFVYASEVYAKRRLDNIGSEVKTLIAKIKWQSTPYEAYKAIVSSILLIKDSLEVVRGAIW